MSTGLALFQQLCEVGNALAHVRDRQEPCSDTWTAPTCILLTLDAEYRYPGAITGIRRSR